MGCPYSLLRVILKVTYPPYSTGCTSSFQSGMVLMYVKGRSMHTVYIAVDAGPHKGVVRRSHEFKGRECLNVCGTLERGY
jgi:hypothetical protein